MSEKFILSCFTVIVISLINFVSVFGQEIQIDRMIVFEPEVMQEFCVLEPLNYDDHFRFKPQHNLLKANATDGGATFKINYLNNCGGQEWPSQAKEAFEHAAEIWGSHLSSSVPISINATWRSLGENTLGSASPSRVFTLTGPGIIPNTFYTIAHVNALLGRDVKEESDVSTAVDINVNISCDRQNWYFGTDAITPPGQFDLVTVLLHEIGHGIGFIGSVFGNNSSQTAEWGLQVQVPPGEPPLRIPLIYDQFALDGNFDKLIDLDIYPNPSNKLYQASIGGIGQGVFFNGLESEFALNNLRVPLWAPNPYRSGSSYSHLDQNFFNTNGQHGTSALMRPQIPTALAIHSPGPVFCGMLQDMAWPLGPACEFLIEDTGPIERPLLSLPGNGVKDRGLNPRLVWNEINNADSYQIQLSRDFLHTNVILNETVTATSFVVNNSLLNSSLYFWRVRAIGPSGTSNWSSTFRFTTQIGLPDQVTLLSPEDGFINVRPGFEFIWQDVPGADQYNIQVSSTANFENQVINQIVTENLYPATFDLDFSTTFYWRVRASNTTGSTDWSDVWSFTTIIEKPEEVTVIVQPAENQIQVPLLTDFIWQPSARATDYIIQISEEKNLSSQPISRSVSSPIFSNSIPLEPAQVYYWRIRATNIGGESRWSQIYSFTTVVDETKINDNFPNPFNTATNLKYQISAQTNVLIDLFDIGGRRVAVLVNENQAPGVYLQSLQANPFASGTYLLRFVADGVMDVQKITIIK